MKLISTTILILIFAFMSFGQESPNNDAAANSAETDRDKAIELYTKEDYKSALPLFDKVLTADKTDHDAWLYFAMSLLKIGDSIFTARLAISPNSLFSSSDLYSARFNCAFHFSCASHL